MSTPLNERVQQIIAEMTASGEEIGLQVAAYVDGVLVVDTWAGVADPSTGRMVDGDTLFTSWSTTKGFVATCVHILADRGRIEYDAPVATYWPEFAANGKAGVTVRHLLTHQAGIPHLPDDVTPEMMTDWDGMCAALAGHAPLWTPGTQTGYHAWTFGWLLGELVRRVDGRPIAQFVQDELCRPLGIVDFYLGLPDGLEERVAPLTQDPRHLANALQVTGLVSRVAPPQVTTAEAVNRPDVRRAAIPGGGGIMNARAIACHYAMLACGGSLDGVRILAPERIEILRGLQSDGEDIVNGGRTRFGLGYMLGGDPEEGGVAEMGASGGEFGHPGNGGSLGFADPARKLGFGLTKNLMRSVDGPEQRATYRVTNALRDFLDGVDGS